MKKFSIIVPSHNGQKYISRCLNSIMQQTYSNYEIIFINDSSTDYTSDIIRSNFNFPNIKYYEVSFEDISKVRNYGLSKVNGDAIIFVDVDDWIEKSLLEKLSIVDNENDIVRYQGIMVDNDNNICEEYITDEFYNFNGIETLNKFAREFEIYSPSWLYAYDFRFWEKNNFKFPVGMLQEDFALTSLILSKAKCVSSIPYIGYYYYKSQNSIMRNNNYDNQIKKAYDVLVHCDKFYEDIILGVQDEIIKNNLIKYYLTIIRHKLNVLNSPEKESYEKQLILREERWK